MTIEALLFDKDGTLFDFAATWENWAFNVFMRLSDHDLQRARLVAHDVGFDMDRRSFSPDSVVIAGTPGEIVKALIGHFDMSETALEALLNEEAAKAPQSEVVELVPFIQSLKARGLKLGVATNDAEAPARAHLDEAKITHLFDFISGYDSGYGAKPDPGSCLGFCKAVALPAARAAMVGDSLHDLRAGRAAGMRTIAVLTGLASKADLAPFADVVLDHIGQIPDWLDTKKSQ